MFYFFLFIFGTAVGSFLNVVIDRLSNEQSLMGRSHCDHCQHQLAWFDLIPIVSFLLLKGKCRYCGKKISWQYPIIELVTGIVFVLMTNYQLQITNQFLISNIKYQIFFDFVPFIVYLGIISCLIVIFFSDLKYHIIPDQIQIALFVFALILLPFQGALLTVFINRVLAAVIVTVPIYFLHWITRGRGMGFGDVKLAFNIGFLFGIKAGLLVLYFAFMIGAVVGLFLVLIQKKGLKSKIAFGPFLVIGMIIMFFWQREVLEAVKSMYGL